MLPREVISITPLPCSRAAAHRPEKAASGMVPIGFSRANKPSPVGIGADSPGQAPRFCGLTRADALIAWPPLVALQSLLPGRCGADATNRGAARRRAVRQLP